MVHSGDASGRARRPGARWSEVGTGTGEAGITFLMALGTLLAMIVLAPVAIAIGGIVGRAVASGLLH